MIFLGTRQRGAAYGPPLFSFFRTAYFAFLTGAAAQFTGTPATATEPIPIAIALPLSGAQAALGREIKSAVELAVADTSAGGNIPHLSITWYDDKCSSEGGLAVAKAISAIADPKLRPALVIGHTCPSAAQAAAPIYNSAEVTYVTAGSLPARVASTQRLGPRHLRLPADGSQGAVIGAALAGAGPDARIAFVRDRTLLAQTALQAAASALTARGRSIALFETFAGADKDFAALAQRIRAANITHLALAAFPSEAVLLIAEVRRANPDITIFATDQLADIEFGRSAGASADGIQVTLAPDARAFPLAQSLAQRLDVASAMPSRAALASYAAIEIVARAAQAPDLLAALTSVSFDTVLGKIRFDTNGAANLPSHVFYTWSAGKLLAPKQ